MARMRALSALIVLCLLFGGELAVAKAQRIPRGVPRQSNIQLPVFSGMNLRMKITVPDRGEASPASVNNTVTASQSLPIPGMNNVPGVNRLTENQAFGLETAKSPSTVSAWIRDYAAMESALNAEEVAKANGGAAESAPPVPGVAARDRSTSSATYGDESLTSIRARQSQEDAKLEKEVSDLIAQGDAAKAAGKPGVAKIYYDMAARKAKQARP